MLLLRFFRLFVLPLLLMVAGTLATVVGACFLAFGDRAMVTSWTFLGIVRVPFHLKPRIVAATVAVLVVVLFVYFSHVSGALAAMRQNNLLLPDFLKLTAEKRQALVSDARKSKTST